MPANGLDDDRVMLQGFYWESSRHGYPNFPQFGDEHWYAIIKREAANIRAGRFDVIWMPPPAFAGGFSAGYDPREYFNFVNSYGTFAEHRAALEALLRRGVEPIADVVINHRAGINHWADFANPAWTPKAITADDECFVNGASELFGLPMDERGAPEQDFPYRPEGDYAYTAFRDLDHTNIDVRRDLIRYMLSLKSLGYRGWRFDMVHGYGAEWVAQYNRATAATFSVGEYDWGQQAEQRGWVWYTSINAGDLTTSSAVFDFSTFFDLKANQGNYDAWYGFGDGIGLVGDTTDNRPWKGRAVTFVENHDTGFRTSEDGMPEQNHEYDSFLNGWPVEQAYAQILTHPGIPTVYWKHYFDWGQDLQNKIQALINARKVAGITASSELDLQNDARQRGVYGARVVGRNGELYVRVGGDDGSWNPGDSGYQGYREYASGTGWRVWVKLNDAAANGAFHLAPMRGALPVPVYQPAAEIVVPDEDLE
jgi:alpha-amylase